MIVWELKAEMTEQLHASASGAAKLQDLTQ